ncbi:MAG: hypothetical protein ACLT38_01695 [Akkermansia sp.]
MGFLAGFHFFHALGSFRMVFCPIFPHGFLFLVGKLAIAILIVLLKNFGFPGFLAGFHFFHAFGSFRMVLKPFFLHSLSFLLESLPSPSLSNFFRMAAFLASWAFLTSACRTAISSSELSVLVGIVFGQYQFFSDNHDTGIDSLHLNSFWPLAVSASGMVAMTSPSFRGLHFRSIGRSLRSGRRRSVLSERGTCGESRGDNHLLGHIFEW